MKDIGYRTDLLFHRRGGIVMEKENHTVIRTPRNPDFFFGNALLLKFTPTSSDFDRLTTLFEQEVGAPPQINHKTYLWSLAPGERSEVAAFIEAGFHYEECAVLSCRADELVPPTRTNTDIDIRPFQGQGDWNQFLALQWAERDAEMPAESYRTFWKNRVCAYRDLINAGVGQWYGAFQGDELVGTLGIFYEGPLGRFQEVVTKASHRNQAICKSLVYRVCQWGFEQAETLLMVADEHYHAAAIYESLGFNAVERQASLCLWPK